LKTSKPPRQLVDRTRGDVPGPGLRSLVAWYSIGGAHRKHVDICIVREKKRPGFGDIRKPAVISNGRRLTPTKYQLHNLSQTPPYPQIGSHVHITYSSRTRVPSHTNPDYDPQKEL